MEEFLHHPLSYYGQLVKRLGSGSYGIVDAYDGGKYGTPVAVKQELRLGSSALREMSVYRTVKHPNILEAIDMGAILTVAPWGATALSSYIVFPLAQGTLNQLSNQWKRDGITPSINTLKRMMYQLVLGLLELHENGRFVHNDLKPQNVLTFDEGGGNIRLALADMGFAGRWVCDLPRNYDTRLRGTLWYRSPELLFESTRSDPASDIWALGLIFFEMVFQMVLIPADDETDAIKKIIRTFGAGYDLSQVETMMELMEAEKPSTANLRSTALDTFKDIASPNIFDSARKKLAVHDQSLIDLIANMVEFVPNSRPTIRQVAQHPFFASVAGDFPPLPQEEKDCFKPLERLERLTRWFRDTIISDKDFNDYVSASDRIQRVINDQRTRSHVHQQLPDLTWRLFADVVHTIAGDPIQKFDIGEGCCYVAGIVATDSALPLIGASKDIRIKAIKALKLLGFHAYRVSSYDYQMSLPNKVTKALERTRFNTFLSEYAFMIMTSRVGMGLVSKEIMLFEYDVDKYTPRKMPTKTTESAQESFLAQRHRIIELLRGSDDTQQALPAVQGENASSAMPRPVRASRVVQPIPLRSPFLSQSRSPPV